MKTNVVHSKFWQDSFIENLLPIEKLIFLYLITNSQINILFCYECSDKRIIYETGCTCEQLNKFKNKVQEAGKIYFKDNYICLKNANKYQNFTGTLAEKGKENVLKEFSNEIKEWFESVNEDKYNPPISPLEGDNKPKIKIIDKDNKQEIEEKLTNSEIERVATQLKVSTKNALWTYQQMIDWCQAKGHVYKDYSAALRNWLRKRIVSGEIKIVTQTTAPPKQKETTEEQRLRNIEELDRVREKLIRDKVMA